MAGVSVTDAQLAALRATLLNTSGNVPLHERFRALFMLKAVGGDEVVRIVAEGELREPSAVWMLKAGRVWGGRGGVGSRKPEAGRELIAGLEDPSALIKHELAYVLGQMQNPSAIPTLEGVLVNAEGKHCAMVRHEAAEALGALSSQSSLPLLRTYLTDPAREVRETCEVAIGKIEYDHSPEGQARQAK